jgi:hypothetical protein
MGVLSDEVESLGGLEVAVRQRHINERDISMPICKGLFLNPLHRRRRPSSTKKGRFAQNL